MDKLNITNSNVLRLYREALRLKQGEKISPWMSLIHLTERCNHNCYGGDCEYADIRSSKNIHELNRDRALLLIDEIRELGSLSILFSGGGEPMLHPAFAEVIERAQSNGLMVGIFSNGSLIEKYNLAPNIVDYATFIRVSIDAASPATFSTVRGVSGSGFKKVIAGVTSLVEERTRKKKNIDIGLKFLISKMNIEEISDIIELGLKIGVDTIQFKPLRGGKNEMNQNEISRAKQLIKNAKLAHPNFIIGGTDDKRHDLIPCFLTPLRAVIDGRGDVMLCNYFNHRRYTHKIGNVYHKKLTDIWFGPEHRAVLQKGIDTKGCTLYDCRFHELNKELSYIIDNFGKTLNFV
ncbi:radical SAM protein [candidate division KSB1 bacterium]|nr:radical SAM protein [candidate division KSB1 bacterium]